MDEIRKAGDYTITQSITIGSKEFVVGEDFKNKDGLFYMIGEYEDVFGVVGRYDNILVSDDFVGLLERLSQRINDEIENLKSERKGISPNVITSDMCIPDDYTKSIVGKVIRARLLHKTKSKNKYKRLRHGKMKHPKIRNLHRKNLKLLTKNQKRLKMSLKRTKTPLKRRKTIMPTNNLQEVKEP